MGTEIDWQDIHARLRSPEGMHVKVRENKFRYIDARQVMDRLDEVVGPQNWHASFRTLSEEAVAVECSLTVYGVTKCDAGYPNNPGSDFEKEPFKAAYSDALKRAAVHFGLGRFLYDDAPATPPKTAPQRGSGAPRAAVAPSATPPASEPPRGATGPNGAAQYQCEDCGADLRETTFKDGTVWSVGQLAGFGQRKHGKTLCMDDYRKANSAAAAAMVTSGGGG
jgi:hypothetical protein